jgi:Raf kinase inhibitor-like YbhB/YbcL family protein
MSTRAAAVLTALVALAGCGGSGGTATHPTVPRPTVRSSITVTSPAFAEGAPIPARYTCRGAGGSPALAWSGVPAGARSLVLLVHDPDAPGGDYVHWLVTGLDPGTTGVPAGGAPPGRTLANSAGRTAWSPPCPPSGTHRYRFEVFALDDTPVSTDPATVLAGIDDHLVGWGGLTGTVRH